MTVGNQPALLLKERLRYQGRKFDFEVCQRRLPNGVVGEWECIRHPGGALAVPLTADGRIILVNQYRFAVQGRLLEFPAGTVEPNEDAAETIQRELEEETGYRAHQWRSLGKFALAPGYSDEYIYAYLAQDLEKLTQPPQQDEDEDIEVVLMTFAEFEQAILSGEPIDAKSITSYFLMKLLLAP
jgi:ADP-ribose pyrophosphatase